MTDGEGGGAASPGDGLRCAVVRRQLAGAAEGQGDALMSYALERCDRDRMPAYLESSNPRNIPFYERHGFERLGEIQVGSSPTLVPMLRRAR